jgi:hypothetical protein
VAVASLLIVGVYAACIFTRMAGIQVSRTVSTKNSLFGMRFGLELQDAGIRVFVNRSEQVYWMQAPQVHGIVHLRIYEDEVFRSRAGNSLFKSIAERMVKPECTEFTIHPGLRGNDGSVNAGTTVCYVGYLPIWTYIAIWVFGCFLFRPRVRPPVTGFEVGVRSQRGGNAGAGSIRADKQSGVKLPAQTDISATADVPSLNVAGSAERFERT